MRPGGLLAGWQCAQVARHALGPGGPASLLRRSPLRHPKLHSDSKAPSVVFCLLAGDPAAALQDLHHSMSLSQQLGETTGDADTLGELADMYAELGDLETAGRFYGEPADCWAGHGEGGRAWC